jgi:hypothetical protein
MRIDVNEIEASRPEDREVALLAAEIRRLQRVIDAGEPTLTAEERNAILWACSLLEPRKSVGACAETAATLRKLLERLT